MEEQATCPAWCDGEHLADPGVDAVHQLALTPVPIAALNRRVVPLGTDVERIVEMTDFEVAAYQYVGSDEIWVVVVDSEPSGQRLEVSLESARRLVRSLARLLEQTAQP